MGNWNSDITLKRKIRHNEYRFPSTVPGTQGLVAVNCLSFFFCFVYQIQVNVSRFPDIFSALYWRKGFKMRDGMKLGMKILDLVLGKGMKGRMMLFRTSGKRLNGVNFHFHP